jgi:uncharacterized delta-60 repeat protein
MGPLLSGRGSSFSRGNKLPTVGAALGALALALPLMGVVVGLATPAWAGPGDLDPTFGTGGKVTTNFFGLDQAFAMSIQPDGHIVAAGTAFNGSSWDFALVRYNPDGTLDPTFGTGGKVTTGFGDYYDAVNAVAIQGDGRIVAAGVASQGSGGTGNFALVRYNPDGTLDPTFGTGGELTTDFLGGDDLAQAVAIQQDGHIVAAGTAYHLDGLSTEFALARYNPDGSLDPTFGTDGKVTTDFFGNSDLAYAVAIQQDDHIVAAGRALNGSNYDFALARYNPDGTLDPSFGTGGKATTDFFGGADVASGLTVQSDGNIVGVGFAFNGSNFDFALARYTPGGTLDPTFGTGGKVSTDFLGSDDAASAVALQADGDIVAAGNVADADFALARYKPNGTLDPTFGTGGKVTTDFFGNSDLAYAVAIQSDGKIVAAGWTSTNYDFALARYDAAAPAGPAISSVNPASVGQGASVSVTIQGTNFLSGAAVSLSGSGVTVSSTTYGSPTKLKAQITVAPDAAVGPRDVTVTDAGGSATCPGCLVIDPGPKPTSASPNTGARGTTERVAIFGSGFQPGTQVRLGKGVTVYATRFLSSSELKANITIAPGAATGPRTVGVVNPDGGVGNCGACFTVT